MTRKISVEDSLGIDPGDVVQVVKNPHENWTRLGIVFSKDDGTLECYTPGRGGFPHQFHVLEQDCVMIGEAKLKFKGEALPDEKRDATIDLDKV